MNTATLVSAAKESRAPSWLSAFERFERRATAPAPSWLRALRKAGIAHFAELGFPGRDHEEWRFTDVSPVASGVFEPAGERPPEIVKELDLAPFLFPGLEASRLVFVDGRFAPGLSSPVVEGCEAGGLARALADRAGWIEPYLGRVSSCHDHAFNALNTAFIEDGAVVRGIAGVEAPKPVHLLFVATRPGLAAQPRNLIVAPPGSRVTVIEDYVSLFGGAHLTNAVTEIVAEQGASVEHVKIQRQAEGAFHLAVIEGRQETASRVNSHSIALGGRVARNDIHLRFNGEGCEGLLNGLFFARPGRLLDHHTLADHAEPRCSSREFYHGILAAQGMAVFNGKILVRPQAQKTDARQTNRNLLLGAGAALQSKPQLEIFADDVKCSHGATVGRLDPEAVFYLQARGIGENAARRMLVQAFAGAILDRIPVAAVREELARVLAGQLDVEMETTGNPALLREQTPH